MTKKELVTRFAGSEDDKTLLAAVLDKYDAAAKRGVPACTKFLSPELQVRVGAMLDYMRPNTQYSAAARATSGAWCVFCPSGRTKAF